MTRPRLPPAFLVLFLLALGGCSRSSFEPRELRGAPLMVADAGRPQLWVLSKQEERREVALGSGRRIGGTRTDTFFHFRVQAFDPVAARPLWERTVLTLGDTEARGSSSRIIGSAADGRLLGHRDGLVWLLVDGKPLALALEDGAVAADAAAIERRNPALAGLLPVEARFYGFDHGLVFSSADGRQFVIRDRALRAEPYRAAAPAPPAPLLKTNGSPVVVPLRRAFGREPARQVRLDGRWLGLFSEKEAMDAGNDVAGDHLRWPYTVLDEGSLARRGFWRADIVRAERFGESFERLGALVPVGGAPVFLNGRFLENLATGQPLVLEDPASVLVWHRTRIDRDGRLALARVGTDLRPLWTAELPLSESGTANPVRFWVLPDRVLAMGNLETHLDGVDGRAPHLVSVALGDGAWRAWDMVGGKAVRQRSAGAGKSASMPLR